MRLGSHNRIIECNKIELSPKDVIEVTDKKDFIFLLLDSRTVFKLGKSYYLLGETVAYVYTEIK